MPMDSNNGQDNQLQSVIASLLGLPSDAIAVQEAPMDTNIRPDMVLSEGGQKYIIEIAGTASVQKVAQLVLYQQLMMDELNVQFVLAAKVIPTSVLELARKTGIRTINLPHGITLAGDKIPQKVKLTTEKAWSVISRLLREKACSIRQIALKEEISYGWAHKVVKRLVARGIAEQNGNLVNLSNVNGLLDAVAWERPMMDLRLGSMHCAFNSTFEAAETITRSTKEWWIPLAFTTYTAASLYIGYGARHDAVYCYIDEKSAFQQLKEELGQDGGIEVIFHKTDRDVFERSRMMEGVNIVSPQQTLLDLAGLGYSSRDITTEMVNRYASIPENH